MTAPVVRLSELVEIQGGGTPDRKTEAYWNGPIPWATVKDLRSGILERTQESITRDGVENSATSVIPAGRVILATRMALGRVAINAVPMAINQDLKALHCKERINPRYLYYFLGRRIGYFEKYGKGATVKGITLDVLQRLKVPLPPISEQRRIVAIFDTAEAIRKARERRLELVQGLRRAIFQEFFSAEIRKFSRTSRIELNNACARITDGTHQSPAWTSSGVPFLFVSNIRNSEISFETEKFISIESWRELTRRCPIDQGDVLYTIVGSYGNAAVVETQKPFAFQRHIAHLKPDVKKAFPDFLATILESPLVLRQVERRVRGIAQKTLNLSELSQIKIFLPPLERQARFCDALRSANRLLCGEKAAIEMAAEMSAAIAVECFAAA